MTVSTDPPVPSRPATAVSAAMPRPATLLRLLAGRGAFRGSVQAMAVALVAVWGVAEFGHFANALGMWAWLVLAVATPEKAALKLLPRTRILTPALARTALRLSAAPLAGLLVALVALVLLAPASTVTFYVTAATWSAGVGLLTTLAGLHRLRGRPVLDAVGFLAAGGVVVTATATTWLTGWAPRYHLLVLVAGIVVIVAGSLAALPRDWVRGPRSQRRLLPRLVRVIVLLGASDVADGLAVGLVYAMLAASGRVTDSGPLYLALLGSMLFCQLVFYVLRVAQPATSARLRGTGGVAGRRRALALLRGAERWGVTVVAVFAVLAAVPATRAVLLAGGGTLVAVLVVLVTVETVLFVVVMYANYLLENTDNAVLVVTSSAAVTGLAVTGVVAVVLVPPLGAVGGVAVLVVAVVAKAAIMRRMLVRNRPELRREPGQTTR